MYLVLEQTYSTIHYLIELQTCYFPLYCPGSLQDCNVYCILFWSPAQDRRCSRGVLDIRLQDPELFSKDSVRSHGDSLFCLRQQFSSLSMKASAVDVISFFGGLFRFFGLGCAYCNTLSSSIGVPLSEATGLLRVLTPLV